MMHLINTVYVALNSYLPLLAYASALESITLETLLIRNKMILKKDSLHNFQYDLVPISNEGYGAVFIIVV